jgi:hypothetical protein
MYEPATLLDIRVVSVTRSRPVKLNGREIKRGLDSVQQANLMQKQHLVT